MRENTIRTKWAQGKAVINGWCSIAAPFGAEVMAHVGWDSLTVDLQHGIIEYPDMVGMLQAISTTPVMPVVRVPWNDPIPIQKALDAGAFGIICPMINTPEECEAFIGAARYAPRGYRSTGPTRVSLYAGSDYHHNAADAAVTLAMIETKQALDNIDAILATPDLDGIYIGPSDLSVSLTGNPGGDPTNPVVTGAMDHILARAKHHGVKAGVHTSSIEYGKKMQAAGYDFITVLSDVRLLMLYGQQTVKEMRAAAEGKSTASAGTPKASHAIY